MNYATLPPEVKNANVLITDIDKKVKAHKDKIRELLSAPDYQKARTILQEQGAKLREIISKEVEDKLALLKVLKPQRQSASKKVTYTFKVQGEFATIVNNGKTLKVPIKEVGYNTAFIGNAQGAVGKVSTIDLTFQQGKSLVKAING